MKVLQRLLTKHKRKELDYDDTISMLTKEDMQKLKEASNKKRSPHRKSTYKIWNCKACGHACFYAVIRCPSCESRAIEEKINQTQYEISMTSQEMQEE